MPKSVLVVCAKLLLLLLLLFPSCVGARCAFSRTFYRSDDLSTPCQCRQLKLNPLSTQINIYCLMTNQTPALLAQRARERELQWCYYSPSVFLASPPPPTRATCIIPTPAPSVHLKIKMAAINGKARYITTISRKNRGLWTVYLKIICNNYFS